MIVDQCKHCLVRGDIEKCKETPCQHHTTWYAETLQTELVTLKTKRPTIYAAARYTEVSRHVDCLQVGIISTDKERVETWIGHHSRDAYWTLETIEDGEQWPF